MLEQFLWTSLFFSHKFMFEEVYHKEFHKISQARSKGRQVASKILFSI